MLLFCRSRLPGLLQVIYADGPAAEAEQSSAVLPVPVHASSMLSGGVAREFHNQLRTRSRRKLVK